MTPLVASVGGALAALLLIIVVLELVRSRRLHERYAVLWLVTGLVVLVLSIWRGSLNWLAALIGIGYAPALLFAVVAVFAVAVLLHISVVISSLSDSKKTLTQEVGLLAERLGRLERQQSSAVRDDPGSASD